MPLLLPAHGRGWETQGGFHSTARSLQEGRRMGAGMSSLPLSIMLVDEDRVTVGLCPEL